MEEPTDLEILEKLDELMIRNPGKPIRLEWIGQTFNQHSSIGGRLRVMKDYDVVEITKNPFGYKLTGRFNDGAPEEIKNFIRQRG